MLENPWALRLFRYEILFNDFRKETKLTPREIRVLRRTIDAIREQLHPGRIVLFGSRAEGRASRGSDFDLAVDQRRPPLQAERQLLEKIDEGAGLYKVDVVYLRSVDKTFKDLILSTGKVVYEKSR
jgi:uncharacterized protein